MKKISKILIFILIFSCLAVNASAADCGSWYVMRNKEHKQPCLEKNFSYIENHNCYYVDKNSENEKVVYLTFDAGYENGNIALILDTLKKHDAQGAFFILENLIKREPDLVLRMRDEGHLVCNHTARHKDMSLITDEAQFRAELESLEDQYCKLTGDELAKFYRPPEGKLSECNLNFADDMGYATVLWSFAYADWDNNKQPDCEYAINKILENLHNGEIMLLHPTSTTNASILDRVMTELENMGYRFGSLEDLRA